jgi:hypothetical protein
VVLKLLFSTLLWLYQLNNCFVIFQGVYPGVIMTILLRRKISYHLLQTYLPSGLFVIVAWLSLFLPPESIPGRVTMAMTTLLTLAAMFGAVRYDIYSSINEMMSEALRYIGCNDILTHWIQFCELFGVLRYVLSNVTYWPHSYLELPNILPKLFREPKFRKCGTQKKTEFFVSLVAKDK